MDAVNVPPVPKDVAQAFSGLPEAARSRLLKLRSLIFEVADGRPEIGRIGECLKWGQPAYLTPDTKSGSTLRLGVTKEGHAAIFAHCQTTIVHDFRGQFPEDFGYEGNRAILLPEAGDPPEAPLRQLIASALTYHLR